MRIFVNGNERSIVSREGRKNVPLIFSLVLLCRFICPGDLLPLRQPERVGLDGRSLSRIGDVVEQSIADGLLPGAVVLVGRGNAVVFRRAFGNRVVGSGAEPMTVDTIFDLASLTKPIATAAAVWKLVELGRLRLRDKVSQFLPEFKTDDKEDAENPIRLFHLLTHTSGLPSYLDVKELPGGANPITLEALIHEIARAKRSGSPGQAFCYSCPGYIILGYIVREVSGKGLNEFAAENIFGPIGMDNTFYCPAKKFQNRIAPTEVVEGRLLRGVVHDPWARLIGGVSGNAGLFSTADDLARFSMMLLNKGTYGGRRIFSPLTIRVYTEVYPPLAGLGRSPGWDIDTAFSSSRGDLFPFGSFGHTGFTGTSIWIDPRTGLFVIFLSNSVHPDGRGDVIRLRGLVANLAAASVLDLGKRP